MTDTTTFIIADPVRHRSQLLRLNIAYLSWVFAGVERRFGALPPELARMPVAEYVSGSLDKLDMHNAERSVFYLIEADGELAGMCGIRYLDETTAEIKRVYLLPGFRGMGLARLALARLEHDAARFGYRRLCLDTGPFMTAAQGLYASLGFADCPAYAGVEVPSSLHGDWRFMHKLI